MLFQFEKRYKGKKSFHIIIMDKTIIKVDYSVRKQIMKLLNVTYPTIRRALNGDTNTRLAQKIRELALLKGGIELRVVKE